MTFPKMVRLFSQECVDLLRQALHKAEADYNSSERTLSRTSREEDSSSDEENNEDSDSSSSSDSQDNEETLDTRNGEEPTDVANTAKIPENTTLTVKRPPKKNQTQRQKEALIQQMGTPPLLSLPLSDSQALYILSALLTKHERLSDSLTMCTSLLEMTTKIAAQQPVVVLLLRSGRFAGGVFSAGQCIAHRACQRYTVRRGQGKAQSSLDSSKRKANSMGAQLRRAGEVNLWEDVKETVKMWKPFLEKSPLILVSCPKTMQKGLFGATDKWTDKMRKIPLDVGRPTYESVCAVHEIMMQATVKEVMLMEENIVEEPVVKDAIAAPQETDKEKEEPVRIKEFPPLTLLHEFAAEGNVKAIEELLETDGTTCAELMDLCAGQNFMTALHYAASAQDPNASAAIVSLLLIQGKANPCLVDGRNRVPYFLASHEKTREAFRRARADLGEECWAWDEEAKVGPALSTEDIEKKQEKVTEKKRRQRARQKEKKGRGKAQAQEMAERAKEQEEERKRQKEAKRVRDGLAPKTSTATNICDFCQKACKGKRRSQMFQRLDYVYCSSDCVQKHKRELMAQAALSRLA